MGQQRHIFRAAGASHDALMAAYEKIIQGWEDIKAFEEQAFGPPPEATTEIMGIELRNYGASPDPEFSQYGTLSGFRFDWNPLNRPSHAHYPIPAIPVPSGWVATPGHPGVYRPDPVALPELTAALDSIEIPSLETVPEVMGPNVAVAIKHGNGSHPRAYHTWPTVHLDYNHAGNMSFVIEAVEDYNGHVFRPADSVPMTEEEWWEFRESYGDQYQPDGERPSEGIALPADYEAPALHETSDGHRYFILSGLSRRLYDEYQGQDHEARSAAGKLMKARKVGHSLKETFAALHQPPTLIDLQRKLTPDAPWMKHPMVNEFRDLNFTVLSYPREIDGKLIVPPPQAREISSQIFNWLRADQMDERSSVVPPPMPESLKHDLVIATRTHAVYELKGCSLEAARDLHQKIFADLLPAMKAGGDQGVYDAFKEKHAALYEAAGQNSHAVVISCVDTGYPRAYAQTPECFYHPQDEDRVILYAPIDYKGRHFAPQDAILLTPVESAAMDQSIYRGGGLGSGFQPLYYIHRQATYGIQIPADFDPATDRFEARPNFPDPDKMARLKRAISNLCETGAVKGVSDRAEFDLEVELTQGENGKIHAFVAAVRKSDGEDLELMENAVFRPVPTKNGYYHYIPQEKTAGGMAMQSFFDDITPATPAQIWRVENQADDELNIQSPPPPAALLHLDGKAAWPFPITAPKP